MDKPNDLPSLEIIWQENSEAFMAQYENREHSFIPFLLPECALRMPTPLLISILEKRLGKAVVEEALNPESFIESPVSMNPSPEWLKRANTVGINVRTIGNFWNVVKYALTLPATQNAIHLLPIWEPGVVSSLYGMASWNINPEFFSPELFDAFPHLDRVEKQLKVVVNLLHGMGKSVGMDVIPHTDRFSEIVLANPQFFEWLCRKGKKIVAHSADLHLKVQELILQFLKMFGGAALSDFPRDAAAFFSKKFGEKKRLLVLFGATEDFEGRSVRRESLMDFLFKNGYEPVPASMGLPYRGLKVDKRKIAKTVDSKGREWRDFAIKNPGEMARVFSPLTRYKLYGREEDNKNWKIDFDKPRKEVWAYICEKYGEVQDRFGFDFMRGDMAHVQMRKGGVPAKVDEFYDPHKAIRNHIRKAKPYFGYFAESFLAPPGIMAYGDEVDHLEMAEADTTLGNLQSMVVGSAEFLQTFRWYLDILTSRELAPNFAVMTADKDDPRFDEFYHAGNEARLFTAFFLADMPSYTGLGFECRDVHLQVAPNEHYTKLFVFKIGNGPKATLGPYVWGKNSKLFLHLTRIRLAAEKILPKIKKASTQWLLPPDPTGHKKIIAWTQKDKPKFVFFANLDTQKAAKNCKIPKLPSPHEMRKLKFEFSTKQLKKAPGTLVCNGKNYPVSKLAKGEGRVYKVEEF